MPKPSPSKIKPNTKKHLKPAGVTKKPKNVALDNPHFYRIMCANNPDFRKDLCLLCWHLHTLSWGWGEIADAIQEKYGTEIKPNYWTCKDWGQAGWELMKEDFRAAGEAYIGKSMRQIEIANKPFVEILANYKEVTVRRLEKDEDGEWTTEIDENAFTELKKAQEAVCTNIVTGAKLIGVMNANGKTPDGASPDSVGNLIFNANFFGFVGQKFSEDKNAIEIGALSLDTGIPEIDRIDTSAL